MTRNDEEERKKVTEGSCVGHLPARSIYYTSINDSRKSKQLPAQKVPALRSSSTFPFLMKKRRCILLLTCLGLILTSHAQQRCVQNQLQILRRRARRTETHESRALRLTPSLYFGSKHIELREIGSGETKSVVPNHATLPFPRTSNFLCIKLGLKQR